VCVRAFRLNHDSTIMTHLDYIGFDIIEHDFSVMTATLFVIDFAPGIEPRTTRSGGF